MKKCLLFFIAIFVFRFLVAQEKYLTKEAAISFYSNAILEDIEAHNKTAGCVLETGTGKIYLSVSIKDFTFTNSLMQQHFNENYMDSDKYPKTVFAGIVENIKEVDFSKEGEYKCRLNGSLTMHGVTKPLQANALLTVKGGSLSASSQFVVKPADFNIVIPAIVRNKIAKSVKVVVKIPSFKKAS